MFTVTKAFAGDFEQVYPLLTKIGHSPTAKTYWKKLFINHWNGGEGYFGFVLRHENKIVGYMGLIFSRREVGGIERKMCDMTSWVVEDAYRNESLRLLQPVLSLTGYTLTNLSASDTVSKIMRALKFVELETEIFLLFPKPDAIYSAIFSAAKAIFDREAAFAELSDEEARLFEDHKGIGCIFFVIKTRSAYCFVIADRVDRRRIPFLKIHYVSNAEIFAAHLADVIVSVMLKARVIGVTVDKRFLKSLPVKNVRTVSRPTNKLFKSDTLSKFEIDSLYSEHVLLKI
jgi:hypothetical protein